jgi:hypothetical protein
VICSRARGCAQLERMAGYLGGGEGGHDGPDGGWVLMQGCGYAVSLFAFYSFAPLLLRRAGAVFFNLSLLSADWWAMVLGATLLDEGKAVSTTGYILGFVLVSGEWRPCPCFLLGCPDQPAACTTDGGVHAQLAWWCSQSRQRGQLREMGWRSPRVVICNSCNITGPEQ